MPIYEYQCTDCGHELEVIQKLSDAPLLECPACNKDAMKKRVSAAAFRLKGGGWYETDFKSGDKKKNLVAARDSSGKEGGADSSGAGKDSTTSKAESAAGSSKDSGSKSSSKPSSSTGGDSSSAS